LPGLIKLTLPQSGDGAVDGLEKDILLAKIVPIVIRFCAAVGRQFSEMIEAIDFDGRDGQI